MKCKAQSFHVPTLCKRAWKIQHNVSCGSVRLHSPLSPIPFQTRHFRQSLVLPLYVDAALLFSFLFEDGTLEPHHKLYASLLFHLISLPKASRHAWNALCIMVMCMSFKKGENGPVHGWENGAGTTSGSGGNVEPNDRITSASKTPNVFDGFHWHKWGCHTQGTK